MANVGIKLNLEDNSSEFEDSSSDLEDQTHDKRKLDTPGKISKPISTNTLQKFLQLKRRREGLTTFAKWKMEKFEEKKLSKDISSKASEIDSSDLLIKETEWNNLKESYIDINSHLSGPISHGESKSGLEDKINDAISNRDVEEAVQLSDELAQRDFGVRISDAFAAKRYADKKKGEKELAKRGKSNKPYWRFQTKQRWEMKGNM